MRFTARMPLPSPVPIRLRHAVVAALLVVTTGSGAVALPGPHHQPSARPGPCGEASADVADFPRVVPLPREHTVRGYLRVDCKQLLDLALETDDLGPVQEHLVRRFRAKGFHGVTSTSRMAEVPTGPGGTEPEVREEFVVRATGHGLRVKVDLSFVGVAPRWSGTALVRYVVRPAR